MTVTDLLSIAKSHARIDFDDDDAVLLLMLTTAANDVAHAAQVELPATSADLAEDLQFAVIDQAAMLFEASANSTERPVGLSMAASRIVARYRGVSI